MRINKNETFNTYEVEKMNSELIRMTGKLTNEVTKTEVTAEVVENSKGDWVLSCK